MRLSVKHARRACECGPPWSHKAGPNPAARDYRDRRAFSRKSDQTPHYEEAIGRTHRAQVDEDGRRRRRRRDVRVSVVSERASERAV